MNFVYNNLGGEYMKKNTREAALKILIEINEKGAYSNIALNKYIKLDTNKLDENLTRGIVYGVLENRIYLDWTISKFSKIKIKKIAPIILEILRIGVYQIIFMERIPDSAAVNESVKLAKKYSHKGAVGYVNGVLRNIARNKEEIDNINIKDKLEYISIKYSHPKWMVRRWIEDFGEEFTLKLCKANNEKPKLNIRTNTLKTDRKTLKKSLEGKGYSILETKYALDGLIVENPYRITDIDEFKNGLFTIQDESSMLVSQIMNPKKNSTIIDICSAPGGKTTHMAQHMEDEGSIIARDIYDHKLKLIKNNSSRLGINIIKTELFDALNIDEKLLSKADYILVDAPCSGLGLIRRRPEIKWNRKEEDIQEIKETQYKILKNGSKYLKPGGILVYSTCTIEREENINIIREFISENDSFELLSFKSLLKFEEGFETAKDGYIELFPHIHGTDGFFIAKLLKKNE